MKRSRIFKSRSLSWPWAAIDAGQQKVRDWNAAMVGVALLVVAAIVIPMLLAILR